MSTRYFAVGVFVISGLTLFALGIFLVGNRHEAFSHHVLLYTEFADLDGVAKGSKVQVAGMDAGQVTRIDVPHSPSGHFRVQMKVDEQFHGLVRTDSIVSIDTEGVVGDTFLTIHPGSPHDPIAQADSVLPSKPGVTMSDVLTQGLGLIGDADAMLKQVGGNVNVVLSGVHEAVGNADDLLVGLREGKGPAGMLLRDEAVAAQMRKTISNAQSMTSNLNQASAGVNSLVADVQQRQLPERLDDTVTQMRSALTRADATIEQVQQTLAQALGPDANGVTAGQNISEALSNANTATGNMAEDTEAIKHNFFFKGYFNKRGYYTLSSLSPEEYRRSKLFGSTHNPRAWLQAGILFQGGPNGAEELSEGGRRSIDTAVASLGDSIFKYPVVVEGYSEVPTPADALSRSYTRAQLVRNYLEARYPFVAKNVGVMPLSAAPPPGLANNHWSGVSIVVAEKR